MSEILIPFPVYRKGENPSKTLGAGRYRLYFDLPIPDFIEEKTYHTDFRYDSLVIKTIRFRPKANEMVVDAEAFGDTTPEKATTGVQDRLTQFAFGIVLSIAKLKRVDRILFSVSWIVIAAIVAIVFYLRQKRR